MWRPLKCEFGQHNELWRIGALRRRFDQRERVCNVLINDRPRTIAMGSLNRELADGLDASRPPWLNGHIRRLNG